MSLIVRTYSGGMRRQVDHPLLDGTARRQTAVVLACCTIVLVVLGVLVAHQSRVDGLDKAIDSWVVGSASGQAGLMRWLASLATVIPAGGTSLVIVVACLLTGRLKGAILAATAIPVASALCDSLAKPLVHREVLAYPSGHVSSILALAAMLTVVLILPPRPFVRGRVRVLILVAAGLAALGVAVAVIALRWHFFTDTIGGAALGAGTVCALTLLLDRPAVSRWLHPAADWLLSHAVPGDNLEGRRPNPSPGVHYDD
jgi:membrane-associated phospholipid phosphatase